MELEGVGEWEMKVALELVLVQNPFGEVVQAAGIALAAPPLIADRLDFFGDEIAQNLINLHRGDAEGS